MKDHVSQASLDWALAHIKRFGDGDLLPVPVEYEAIAQSWGWLRDQLAALDLSEYSIGALQRFWVPKSGGGFRVATQLDPVDTLLYTAMVYEIAQLIEASRVPIDRRIACSYRIALDGKGTFFREDNGWPDFHAHSRELAEYPGTAAVLVADISDFYNQIYHHRVENALDAAGAPAERINSLRGFVSQLTATQSRGLPVGPYASIVLAESCLSDADDFLLRRGLRFTRYVDDFRIFCDSSSSAVRAWHDLTDYLNSSQRLTLVPRKTRILSLKNFMRRELRDPQEQEAAGAAEVLEKTLSELAAAAGYGMTSDGIETDSKLIGQVTRDNLRALFDECVAQSPLNLGLARHLLRRASQIDSGVLLLSVMQNLDKLTPALRDTVRYLRVAIPKKNASEFGSQICSHFVNSAYNEIPFLHLWLLELLRLRPDLCDATTALQLAEASRPHLGWRPTALLAGVYEQADWVRAHKETWRNNGDWDRRAILMAGTALPRDEKRHWLAQVRNTRTGLDKAVAAFAAQS